jgi:hypothetical protein
LLFWHRGPAARSLAGTGRARLARRADVSTAGRSPRSGSSPRGSAPAPRGTTCRNATAPGSRSGAGSSRSRTRSRVPSSPTMNCSPLPGRGARCRSGPRSGRSLPGASTARCPAATTPEKPHHGVYCRGLRDVVPPADLVAADQHLSSRMRVVSAQLPPRTRRCPTGIPRSGNRPATAKRCGQARFVTAQLAGP